MTADPEKHRLLSPRLVKCFEQLPLEPETITKLVSAFQDEAVEVHSWAFKDSQLTTVVSRSTKPHSILGLEKDDQTPLVVYYKPKRAAQLLVSIVGGVVGASSFILLGLAVISAILALEDIRTAASPAECLIFWILYSAEGHRLDRSSARERFCEELKSYQGIESADFEPALHALVRLGCLQETRGFVEIADKMIIRRG